MTRCPQASRVQDFLDGDLPPAEAAAFRAHLATCRECAGEVALFQRLIVALELPAPHAPPAALTDRVLARVLPSKLRRRRLAVLGWSYLGALTACAAAAALVVSRPDGRAALEAASAALSRWLVGSGLFVLNALGVSAVRLADGWGLVHAVGQRIAPVTRALAAVFSQPSIVVTVWAAALACVALLWWMRPRAARAARGVGHVGILGF